MPFVSAGDSITYTPQKILELTLWPLICSFRKGRYPFSQFLRALRLSGILCLFAYVRNKSRMQF